MKKILSCIVLGLLCLSASAIPADPTPIQVTQPDGSKLTLTLHGDEFIHYTTTLDGYTVMKNGAGYYTYARLDGDQLVAGDRIARDAGQRSAADLAALATMPRELTSQSMVQNGARMLSRRNSAMRRVGADGRMDYDRFRGLIILINYNDKQFSMNNASSFYNDMVNKPNYTGYNLNGRRVNMTGSVRDYFYDNSNHMFDPAFDVVGPVDVDYSCKYPNGTASPEPVFYAALDAADKLVDFSDYDSDGDGYVDMVFFLVAGFSSNYSGNADEYLWPHMFYLYYAPPHDGKRFGLYACSTEIAGWEGYYSDVNGIGTFCHEFGHVLGLPDLYDTDYKDSGGESRNPGQWSIMAGGSGNNFGRNPVGYSLYERYSLGFSTPQVIRNEGTYELQALDQSNEGLRLNTVNRREYFLLENRQAGKWDQFLMGHGMLVARVDSSNVRVWTNNEVNVNPNHMYYELLRAKYNGSDSGSDPFPGTEGVTRITNFTNPSLQTWDKNFNKYAITDITENNGVIRFNVTNDNSLQSAVEDFENMPLAVTQSDKDVKGVFAKWDFSKCGVAAPSEGECDGTQAVAMIKPSQLATAAPMNICPYLVNFTVYNPTGMSANFRLSYSKDGGTTWTNAPEMLTVAANSQGTMVASLPTDAPIMIRINQTAGSSRAYCYLDNIKFFYTDLWGPELVEGDVDGDGEVTISDINAVISIILGVKDTDEERSRADVNGDGEINISDANSIINLIVNAHN